ncbi:MAG: single-stranded-DNA-specific exonuclease RecJ [Candidatus Portnoybacteria bacterium]|nr:single-stranded-DNA-specific exonuclease RecJ [Candidatus Portnoybacteria bacterium]
MNKNKWVIKEKAPQSFLNNFPEYSKTTLQLLWNRGLRNQNKIDEFFNPDYDQDLHDPFLLKDIKKGIKRIKKASREKEKVAIFADFDADGVCGATILKEIFSVFKIKPTIYIPDRNKEGYGMNIPAVKKMAEEGVSLIVTVDCGVTDFKEIRLANKLGIDVIVVDHHEIPEKRPAALAVINPKQKDCKYPFNDLSGAGVAFKLAQAIRKLEDLPISWEKWLLDLVAISIATDSMPLLGENRALAKYGLVVLSQTKRKGLRALMETARIEPIYNQKTESTNLTINTLAFVLGPRINAASRVKHAKLAYDLLNSTNLEKAKKLSNELEMHNRERKKLMDKMFSSAKEKVIKRGSSCKIVFEGDEKWSSGLAGLVAQKLLNEFWCPCFIFQKLKEKSTGSIRSLPGFDAVKALKSCKDLLEEFGGHPQAAGFTILNKNLESFEKKIGALAKKELKKKAEKMLEVDMEVGLKDLNWSLLEDIENFSPFGEGNPFPCFLIKKIEVSSIRSVGVNGNHLKLYLKSSDWTGVKKIDAIGFGLSDFYDKIGIGDKIDVIAELMGNYWNGSKRLQLRIIDIKKRK